jgi:hypothetical protein
LAVGAQSLVIGDLGRQVQIRSSLHGDSAVGPLHVPPLKSAGRPRSAFSDLATSTLLPVITR